MSDKELVIKAAKEVREHSYAIFSKFKVGAALITKNKKIYKGTNVESASYGLSMCAERNCIFNAYSNGVRKNDIVALAIIGKTKGSFAPCGACLQIMSELLNEDTPIYLVNLDKPKIIKEYTIKKLLPLQIGTKDIQK